MIQALFDYTIEEVASPVASSFKTAKISKVINPASSRFSKSKLIVIESEPDSSPDSSIINKSIKFENNNFLRPVIEKNARRQREKHLRK